MQSGGISNAIYFPPWYLQAFIIKYWGLIAEENKFQWREENLATWSLKYFVVTHHWLYSEGNLFQFQHVMRACKKLNIVKLSHPSCWVFTFIIEIQSCNWSEAEFFWFFSCSRKCWFWILRRVTVFGYSDLSFFSVANLEDSRVTS